MLVYCPGCESGGPCDGEEEGDCPQDVPEVYAVDVAVISVHRVHVRASDQANAEAAARLHIVNADAETRLAAQTDSYVADSYVATTIPPRAARALGSVIDATQKENPT